MHQKLLKNDLGKKMDFGKILAEWNNIKKNNQQQDARLLKKWLDTHPPSLKDKEDNAVNSEINEKKEKIKERQRLRNMKPQKTLDLHGLTVKEALVTVENFLKVCQAQHIKKVLIIHGKGLHSKSGPVLNQQIRQFLEKSPLAGEIGIASSDLGGKGALWVILKSPKGE